MGSLTQAQVESFNEQGYLVVEDLLEPEVVLDPVIEEYHGVLDRLADYLHNKGELASRYEELPFSERITQISAETGKNHQQFYDFSLPFKNVKPDTPFWTGPAVFNAFVYEPLLDVIESLIGPEIYSNPVQHVRIKPPEQYLPKNDYGDAVIGKTAWHQDHGVVTPEADDTRMLTVWFPLLDAPIEKGPLRIVPGSHKGDLLTHCLNYTGNKLSPPGGRQIPEKLFPVEMVKPVPLDRGSVLFLHKRTVHGSLSNVSEEVRWSFDLRYNPTGEPTGRHMFPGFVARSRANPETELRDPDHWSQLWLDAREKMALINQDGESDVKFGRWGDDHPDCA